MIRWIKSLFPRKNKSELFEFGGVEPDLDQYALDERANYIQDLVERGKTQDEATHLADSWFIMEVQAQYGGRAAHTRYVPRPLWDWDWAWRQMFDTWEEAEAHVADKRNNLIHIE